MRRLPLLCVAIVFVCACGASSARTVKRLVAHVHRKAAGESCDRYASPGGSDPTGRGTFARPFQTLTMLDRSLHPGQTGCLMGGSYGGLTAWHRIDTDGTSSERITIRGVPGQTATVTGWVDVEADYTTLEHLRIDGSNTLFAGRPGTSCREHVSQSLVVAGHNDTLQYDDYFQSVAALRSNGIGVGFWGDPNATIIRHDRIHDVGGCDFYDHMIYLDQGYGAQIYDNWMWNDPHGWGIKLDPGPTGARVWGNVINRAGSGFMLANSSGDQPTAGNQVFDNIVMNSVGVWNPDGHWHHPGALVTSPGMLPSSTGNAVFGNDSYHNQGGVQDVSKDVTPAQLQVTGNFSAVPQFVNAASHDYALLSAGAARARRLRHAR